MLTPETSELLKAVIVSINMGSRDANNSPSLGPVFAFKYDDDKNELTLFSMPPIIEMHLANLTNNGKMTVVIANPGNHITNQFKGDYVSHAVCDAGDLEFARGFFKNFQDVIGMKYGEQMHEAVMKIQVESCAKVTMKVKEIYDQTPGPGAGKLITEFV